VWIPSSVNAVGVKSILKLSYVNFMFAYVLVKCVTVTATSLPSGSM
jgi:hypothetical protein